MIEVSGLTFAYPGRPAVFDNLSLTIWEGTYTAIMGPSGSGKSTLALILKGLLAPGGGSVTFDGIKLDDEQSRYEIMKRVGLVFQNPENTIVATTVETELAFGLENLGISPDEMHVRVEDALVRFNLAEYRHVSPSNLSGGEKQRLALAAVMIMNPSCLILDEPTSLLDPPSRSSLHAMIKEAVHGGATVIHITPFSFEARHADRLIVLDGGLFAYDGVPEEVLALTDNYLTGGMEMLSSPDEIPSAAGIKREFPASFTSSVSGSRDDTGRDEIVLDHVGFTYSPKTPFSHRALFDVALRIPAGSSTVLMGASGSGKTTLLEIVAGITVPTEGDALFTDGTVHAMAFQLPEDQMVGHTVSSYVAFGPGNLGMKGRALDEAVTQALFEVGFDPADVLDRDPAELSGGEKRRAALAGVLAMNPGVLVLDEPTAGLDRGGMETVLVVLDSYRKRGGTLIFSTHDLEVAHRLADRAVILDRGRIETTGSPEEVFRRSAWLDGFRTME